MDTSLITTGNTLEGYRISQYLGIVRGITVRSRSVLGNLAGGLQSLMGGKLSIYVDLCETARQEAFDHMVAHAQQMGGTGIIAFRYDANEVLEGITEVLAYGTAVKLEPMHG